MTEKEYYTSLGNKLRVIREGCGMSRTEVAKSIGVTPSFISLIEKGEKVSAFRLEQVLGVLGLEFEFAQKKTSLMSA